MNALTFCCDREDMGSVRLITPPFVAIVIAHWVNMDDTVECLESIGRLDYPRFAVYLVSNGSTDFDEGRARQAVKPINIIFSQENLGFTGGNNLGIRQALKDGADLVLLLNNDTTVDPDLIAGLLPPLESPDVGIVGPAVRRYYQPDKIASAGGLYSRLIGYSYLRRPLEAFQGCRVVDWIDGCALMAKREVFERVGLLWDPYYLNCEEIDFCLQAARCGFHCVQVGMPLVSHKISASGGIRGRKTFSPDKAYYYARNNFHLVRRTAGGVWRLTGLIGQFLVALPYWALLSILERNPGVLRDYLEGMWHGIRGLSGRRHRHAVEIAP